MRTDYREVMGVDKLASETVGGMGVTVAVLDSGCPVPCGFPACAFIGPSEDMDDVYGHATAIASILFGAKWIRGVCEGARPLYIKVLDDNGSGTVESVARGIYEAIDQKADVINLSLGFVRTKKCPKPLEKACDMAEKAGIPIICAAGNDGGPVNWPAALKNTICVGSADENGLKTSFSSVGEVDFIAPGLDLGVIDEKGRLEKVSGTSFSAALVTGVAALLIGKRRKVSGCNPLRRNNDYVKAALKCMAQDVDAKGWDKMTGHGLIARNTSGKFYPTTCMKMDSGFFGRILCKLKSLFRP